MSIFWLSIVLQDVTTGGSWVKCTRDLSVLFLTTICKSTIISIISIQKRVNENFSRPHSNSIGKETKKRKLDPER